MEPTLEIRHARAEDAEALVRLSGQLGYEVTADDVVARLTALPATDDLVVAESDGQVIGWIHLAIRRSLLVEPYAAIEGLVVEETWRGRGVGHRLLELADEVAIERGVGTVRLRSNVIRGQAHSFYRREGFEETKRQVSLTRRVDPTRTPALG